MGATTILLRMQLPDYTVSYKIQIQKLFDTAFGDTNVNIKIDL